MQSGEPICSSNREVGNTGFGKILLKVAPTAESPVLLAVAMVEAAERRLLFGGVMLTVDGRIGIQGALLPCLAPSSPSPSSSTSSSSM